MAQSDNLNILENELNNIFHRFQSALRDFDFRESESIDPNIWTAFFHSLFLGVIDTVSPGMDKHNNSYEIIQSKFKNYDSEGSSSQTFFKNFLYLSIQFWNANSQRVTAFSINQESDRALSNRTRKHKNFSSNIQSVWNTRWETMAKLNDLTMDHSDKGFQSATRDLLPNSSIGNLVVNYSNLSSENQTVFKFGIGVRDGWNKFVSKKTLRVTDSFDLPKSLIESIFLAPINIDGKAIALNQFLLLNLPSTDQARIIHEFCRSETKEYTKFWDGTRFKQMRQYFRSYIKAVYPKGYEEPELLLSDIDINTIITNNLCVAFESVCKVKGETALTILKQYQYCIPVWNIQTSYLYISTKTKLSAKRQDLLGEFAQKLFLLCWLFDSQKKLEEDKLKIDKQNNKVASAAILARNFSHSIGSHVLASSTFASDLNPIYSEWEKVNNEIIKKNSSPQNTIAQIKKIRNEIVENGLENPTRLRLFFEYMQARFDYIAGAVGGRNYMSMPCSFSQDIFEPFLEQSTFIDHFIKDLEWDLSRISFKLHFILKNREDVTSTEYTFSTDNSFRQKWIKDGTYPAFMTAFPRTMSGRHALYSIFENSIRNSLKYRGKSEHIPDKYIFEIAIIEEDSFHEFFFWDNLSNTDFWQTNGPLRTVKKFLSEPLFDFQNPDDLGQGLGVKEMRIATSMLAGNDFNMKEGYGVLKLGEIPKQLRSEDYSDSEKLIYSFKISPPIFLAYLGVQNTEKWIRSFTNVEEASASGARILLISGDQVTESNNLVINSLQDMQGRLPFRTFILCKNSTQLFEVNTLLESRNLKIPTIIETNEDLPLAHFLNGKAHMAKSIKYGDLNWEQSIILYASKLWIMAWKPINDQNKIWNLIIGIDASLKGSNNGWCKFLESVSSESKDKDPTQSNQWIFDFLSVVVKTKNNQFYASPNTSPSFLERLSKLNPNMFTQEMETELSKKQTILFDNHGIIFPFFDVRWHPSNSVKSYNKFHGNVNPKLYELLSVPPSDFFNFHMLILELLEAGTMSVALLDERIVYSTHSESKNSRTPPNYSKFFSAGVFPIETVILEDGKAYSLIETSQNPESHEGIAILDLSVMDKSIDPISISFSDMDNVYIRNLDAIIIHEGIIDQIADRHTPEIVEQFMKLPVRIYTTSGRGGSSRYASDLTTFIETSSIHASILPDLDKIAFWQFLVSSR